VIQLGLPAGDPFKGDPTRQMMRAAELLSFFILIRESKQSLLSRRKIKNAPEGASFAL
jgi:hypothetical protein